MEIDGKNIQIGLTMKIDSHQHFWYYKEEDYRWIHDEMQVLKRNFLPNDLVKELKKIGFDGSISIQARQSIEETEWLLNLANEYPFILGVVGWVDLRSKELYKQLEKFSQNPKFVGVRHVVQDEPDDEFLLRNDFIQGIEALKDFSLTYDILIYERHLPVAIRFIEKFPDQVFVIDHIAKPDIKNRSFQNWSQNIKIISEFSNVYCKLSGMVTENDWVHWKNEDFYPYIDFLLETFSYERLLIGSDWPVCTLAGPYEKVMNIVIGHIKDLPLEYQKQILGENAIKAYNLKV